MKRNKILDWLKYDTDRAFWMVVICAAGLILNLAFMFQNDGLLSVQFTGTLLVSSICGGFSGATVTLLSYFILATTTGAGVGKGVFLLLICLLASIFSAKGWFRTVRGVFGYIVLITSVEELFMFVVYTAESYIGGKDASAVLAGMIRSFGRIIPGVLLAVMLILLFYRYAPDRILLFFGNSQHYIKDKNLRKHVEKNIFDSAHGSLRRKITTIILVTATTMMIASVIFVNILIVNTMNGTISLQLDFWKPEAHRRVGEITYEQWKDEYLNLGLDGEKSLKTVEENEDEVIEKIEELQSLPDGISPEARQKINELKQTIIGQSKVTSTEEDEEEDAHMVLNTLKNQFSFYLQMIFSLLMVEMVLVILIDAYAQRKIVRPILGVASAMDQLAYNSDEERRESLAKIHAMEVKTGDEVESLYHAVDKTASELLTYIADKEKQVLLENELKITKAANDAKTSFLSNMSHEIRTPINAVLGMDEMILRESEDQTILRYAKNIQSAGKTLLGLINDILDFSKIEAGKMEIIPVDYELSSVVNDLVNMIRSRVDAKKLDLIVDVDHEMPHLLRGDEIRIKQVVLNILTNAVKYTEKGSITLSIRYEKKSEESIDLKIAVKDTGAGIKEEDVQKLFAPFERIEEEKNRTIEGTGLGMSITQKLLGLMDSKLELESVYGEGSNFHFSVPQQINSWEAVGDISLSFDRTLNDQPRYQESFRAPKAEILVVDDTEMNLTVVRGLLKKTDVKIDTATSGRQCLKMIAEKRYDIIFLDHRMPELDGMETLALIRKDHDHPNQETPVVALTANAISGARENYIGAGFVDYMTKPIDSARLERMMIGLLPPEKVEIIHIDESQDADEIEKLEPWVTELAGIDLRTGIRNTGSAEDFMKALQLFADNISENIKNIRLFYERDDFHNYNIKVHSLKSSARMIGAAELSKMAEELENASVDGAIDDAEIGEKTPVLLREYEKYLEILAPFIHDDTEEWKAEMNDPSKEEIPQSALDEAYGSIKECVEALDYDSIDFLIQSIMKYRIPDKEQQKIITLRKKVSEFDWDAVEELLSD